MVLTHARLIQYMTDVTIGLIFLRHALNVTTLYLMPGTFMGNVVTMPVAGLLCEYGFAEGWGSVFYVFGKFYSVLKRV